MPTIKIEIDVPDNDCGACSQSRTFAGRLFCSLSETLLLIELDTGKYQRCQECIDAEVKDADK